MLVGVVVVLCYQTTQAADEPTLPVHKDDRATLEKIVRRQKLDAPPTLATKGWPLRAGEKGIRYASKENPKYALTVVCNAEGRVVKLLGNGPLLSDDSLRLASALPELRFVRIDHNMAPPKSDVPPGDYSGAGFAALSKSKLEEVRIGHGFNDEGMKALASIPTLRRVDIVHSKVSDKGLAALKGHAAIEEFKISSQARPQHITEKSIAVLATLPKLRVLGVNETFLTYEGGLKHLAEAKQPLESLSLKHSLVLPADVTRLQKALPRLKIETSTPAEILATPNARGVLKWASAEAQTYLKSGEKK
jgi:hypothetical protein